MNLANVMDELGDAVDTIDGLRVKRYPADDVSPPAAVVAMPDDYTFDATYGRGADEMTISVWVVVDDVVDRVARDRLAAYCDGSGASSVKAAIDGYGSYTALDFARVTTIDFAPFTIADVDYMAAEFSVHVMGHGTS